MESPVALKAKVLSLDESNIESAAIPTISTDKEVLLLSFFGYEMFEQASEVVC